MLKKPFSAAISVILAIAICICTCTSAFAASSGSKKYISEVILSYGNTDAEAKQWLTDNGYEVLDNNLNEGADALLSTKRAVYLGYKTTNKADEAITDMKVMNMQGGYSVQDYQMMLSEQKDNIKTFFDNFKVAVQEYRDNYNAGQQRAIAAHDMLNMLYEDDTQQYMGDLLLNRVREEYTDDEYNALSAEEQAKIADMTTVLMQGNADAVLTIEQTIATATDEGDTLWFERYDNAKTYDEMLDELMESENLTVNQAEKELAAEYDGDAYSIATKLADYKTYLEKYTNSDISFESTADEISAYKEANEDFDMENWFAAGTQYEVLKSLVNDDISLYDLITGDDYDVAGEDRYMLYPLVSVLTEGQRACIDFLTMYQIVCLGTNNDEASKYAMDEIDVSEVKNIGTSVYSGVDRTVFGGDVALTGDAYKLQASSGSNPTDNWIDNLSIATLALYGGVAVSIVGTIGAWIYNARVKSVTAVNLENIQLKSSELANEFRGVVRKYNHTPVADEAKRTQLSNRIKEIKTEIHDNSIACGNARQYQKIVKFASVAVTCVMLVLLVASLWSTWQDLNEYYKNVKFTPIPSNMVNQGVNDDDEKVFTYYKAVKCNRVAQNMVTDNTKLLGDYGDLNGDVGRQWLALYTTTDKAAGDPITADFAVQYSNTNIPNNKTALSIFCESVAQNLTDKKAGYTFSDDKGGIYLFYGTDESAFAGSVISSENVSLAIAAAAGIVIGVVIDMVLRKAKEKKKTA